MTSFKIACLYIFVVLISFTFTACSENSPSEPETEKNLEIDTTLLGTWEGINSPRTITFSKVNESEGSGTSIWKDFHEACENQPVEYLEKRGFKWTQVRINPDGWSAVYYKDSYWYECDGKKILPPLEFEYSYLIEGDTLLWGGRQSYSFFLKVD